MDFDEIRKWHSIFKPNNELFEIRVLGDKTYSAYFTDIEEAIKQLPKYDNSQIYFTVNKVNDACASRKQFNNFMLVQGTATSKNDITRRLFIPIDIDVERPSGICSTNEEKEYAHQKALTVFKFLKENNFAEPVICDSSSGYHIYYPVDMEADQQSESDVKKFFGILSNFFTDERVKIDRQVGDANRIMRLCGTWSRKGRNTPERPHRMAKILRYPSEMRRMSREELEAFIDKYEIKEEQKETFNTYHGGVRQQFDLHKFMEENNIEVAKETPWENGGTKYVLKECPFDHTHHAPDSAIFLSSSGAIAFRCLHNSCSCYDWRALRLKFNPHAYDKKEYEPRPYTAQPQARQYVPQKPQYTIKEESEELGKKWLSMSGIKKVDLSSIESMKTGYKDLDRNIVGLNIGEVSILSGSNSSGKSSWINNLMLNVIQQGYKVALWSGELPPAILKTWIQMCAAGKQYLRPSKIEGRYYVPNDIAAKIDAWLDGKFYLYNNEYSNKWQQIFNDMNELLKIGVKLFILDNLFSLDVDIFEGDKNNKHKELILEICKFAKKNGVHILLVAHPRKTVGFLRKNDISGTADLTNAVDNVFICHRVNNDFFRAGKEFFGEKNIMLYKEFGNVIEIAKNRLYGAVDVMCGMHYEIESRRFKNTLDENIQYGWSDGMTQAKAENKANDNGLPFESSSEEAPF